MDFMLNAVSGVINKAADILGGWSFTRNLGADIRLIMPWLQRANWLLPVSEYLSVLSLWVTVNVALAAYYWITRAINLLRGAG